MKAVNYNDMIAVLALGMQSIDTRLQQADQKLDMLYKKQDTIYVDLSDRMAVMEVMIKKVLNKSTDVTGADELKGSDFKAKLDQAHEQMRSGINTNSTAL